jgi:hypothetical protein
MLGVFRSAAMRASVKRKFVGRWIVATALVWLALPSIADACPNEVSSGFRAYLPDCRAYELVSPSYKEGFPVFADGISEDGLQLRIESLGNFSSPDNTGTLGESYRVVRTESGWASSPLDTPFSMFPVYLVQGTSTNFESSLWFASVPGQSSRDVYLDLPDGPSARLIRMGPGAPAGNLESGIVFAGASENLLHVLLRDVSPETGEEDHLWPGDTTVNGRKRSLYEYEGTGNTEPRLVGVSNEERLEKAAEKGGKKHINEAAKLVSNCGTTLGSSPSPGGDAYNAVSASGATVFFTADACGTPRVNELYARIDGERTVAISEPSMSVPGRECAGKCATAEPAAGTFAGASRDGTKVFFLTSQPLVGGDGDGGVDLYEAEIPPGAVARLESGKTAITRLVQVSHGGVGDLTPGSGANVLGVSRVSEDGSHVYFVAEGSLTGANSEGMIPVPGGSNMYVFVSECPTGEATCANPVERTSFIATLSPGDGEDWSLDDARPVQATPNGRFLVFQSVADLTSDEEGRVEAGQIFEYGAEAGTLVRVSRSKSGYNEDGNTDIYAATIPIQGREYSTPEEYFKQLAVTEDGSRVFFSSHDALTPQGLIGANNIYEYHNGQTALISDGHDALNVEGHPATELIATDESGRDVFFRAADRLVPQDSDTQVDIYDAREDGGFPGPAGRASCSGDSCQGPVSESPSLIAPLTSVVTEEPAGSTPRIVASAKPKAKTKTRKSKHNRHKGKARKGKKAAEGGK